MCFTYMKFCSLKCFKSYIEAKFAKHFRKKVTQTTFHVTPFISYTVTGTYLTLK